MSLHVLANHMASKGRDGDSMLVHMTPGEVHGLQALAMKHGGSLTINPDTGLPEANFLKSLLPIIAGFALGPAGFGIAQSAMGAAAMVGGVTGIATGSLSKGLMAGLGAYGGFGIGEALAGAGADAMTRTALSAEGALPSVENIAQVTGEGYGGSAANYSDQVNTAVKAARDTSAAMPTSDLMSAGAKSAMADPLGFAKQNWKPIAAAALPILSDIGTTTPSQAPTMAPGRIREKRWDGRQFVDVASTDAGVYNTSNRNFSDLYRGYNDGGIVALAGGGDVQRFAIGRLVEGGPLTGGAGLDMNNEIYKYFSDPATQALLASGNDKAVAQALQDRNYSLADVAKATGTQDKLADYEKRFVNAVATPGITAGQFNEYTADVGLTGQNLATALQNSGQSQSAQYALTHNLNDAAGITGAPQAVQNFYNAYGYKAGDAPGDQGGLSGLYANINYSAKRLQDQINAGKLTAAEARSLSQGEMTRLGMSMGDVKAATGFDLANLFKDKAVVKDTVTGGTGNDTVTGGGGNDIVVPSGYHLENGVLVKNISATQNTTTNVATPTDLFTAPATSLPVGVSGNTGPSQIGGGATVNPNGTITTSPRIPGIPVGGFTDMQNLRDVYTKGGGSLGYTSPTFKTIEDFNAKYLDRMGGDSLAALNYLAGKGGAKYPTKSGVGRISEAYDEAVLGYPARGNLPYIYNKTTGKMDVNPDYVAPGRDAAGNVTYSMSLNDIKSSLKETPLSGQALYDWAVSNNLSAQQIADATGRSLSSVYSDFRAGSKAAAKKKEDDKAAGVFTDQSSTGGSDGGGGGGGTGTGPGGVGGAGGPGSTTAANAADMGAVGDDGGDNDAVGGYYSRGKLNYRAKNMAMGGATGYAIGGGLGSLGSYSDGGRLLKGPGDGVSDSIPATIGQKQQPARLADGEFVVPARIVSELGNGSTDAGAKKLYAMMDRVQRARGKTTGKNKVAANSRADKYLPA